MGKYILQRLLIAVPMVIAISAITFFLANMAPGDPILSMFTQEQLAFVSPEFIENKRREYGLDKPVPVRYVLWLGQIARGNFGFSYASKRPVISKIRGRIGPTLELTFTALLIGTVGGTIFGVIAALKQYSIYDYVLSFISLIGLSVPVFFMALILLFLLVLKLPLFPSHGMSSELGAPFNLWTNLYHLILPASVLSIELLAVSTRYTRTAMLEVLNSDYVTTARAKGLSEWTVIVRHAFRNALLPLITITSLRLPLLFSGALIIEQMFAWPGMGMLSIRAIRNADYPTLMGLTFFVAVVVLASNLLADIFYAVADPRIRTG